MTTRLPSWVGPSFDEGQTLYPSYHSPILEWRPSIFEGAFVALHPFCRDDRPHSWARVAADLDFDIGRLNRALLTCIGALREEFRDDNDASRLKDYCRACNLDFPQDGQIPAEWTQWIADLFREHGFGQVWVRSEFGDTVVVTSIDELALGLEKVSRRGAIFSASPGLLVTADWDSFFTLFLGTERALASVAHVIEGFFCNAATSHYWGRPNGSARTR